MSSIIGTAKPKPKDHRVRVAAERRERMRFRLQDAIVASYALNPDLQLPSVEAICAKADVSRATFYKHFDSVQDAGNAIGQAMLDEMFNSLVVMIGQDDPPLERVAIGVQMFLMRSATDAAWASFVSRAFLIGQNTDFFRGVSSDLRAALDDTGYEIRNFDAIRSLILGATIEGIRHVHQTGDRRREYAEDLTTMILRAVGAETENAISLVRKTSIYIRGLALESVSWWKDPWI